MNFWNKLFKKKKQVQEVVQKVEFKYNKELYEKNLSKWAKGREQNNENPNDINEVFSFLIKNKLFSDELNKNLDEYFEYQYHLGEKKEVLIALLVNNTNSYCYESEVDCLVHPYNFDDFFYNEISPILTHNNLTEILFSFTKKGDGRDFEYQFEFTSSNFKVVKQTYSDSDIMSDFFDALNKLLVKMEYEKRFYDLIGTTMILLDQYQKAELKINYNLTVN